jgi:predicted membrane-bound mannosyltransferase
MHAARKAGIWTWGLLLAALVALLQYRYSEAHPPIGTYVVVLGLAAAFVTLRDHPQKWERAAWVFMMFVLAGLEISNLYRDQGERDAQAKTDGETQARNFQTTLDEFTGGNSYAVASPIWVWLL